jgi:hypothetical protein
MQMRGLALIFVASSLLAQRVFEKEQHVIYEDATSLRADLGIGHSPVLTRDGKVVLVRGRYFDYGARFDCANKETKNWVASYDPATRSEQTLFDRALPFERTGIVFCVFNHVQLSPDGSTLYLVSSVWATAGSLAIVQSKTNRVKYVGGVNDVFVIQSGDHAGELIYQRRTPQPALSGYYPWVHAAADGTQIKELDEEMFTSGGDPLKDAPNLASYLRRIKATIFIGGIAFP